MNKPTPLFRRSDDGEEYFCSYAGTLLLLAGMAYGPQDDPDWKGRPRAEILVFAILSAARAGGYTQCDIFHTLLERDEVSLRVKAMAQAACTAAGDERIGAILAGMRGQKI